MGKKKAKLAKLWPLNDPDALVNLISELTETPKTEVSSRLLQEFEQPGCTVSQQLQSKHIPSYQMTPQLAEFYKHSDAFLYETSVANFGIAKDDQQCYILSILQQHIPANGTVFCFGDGLGFDSCRFAQYGYQVLYHEPGLNSNKYAAAVFRHNNVENNVTILESLEDITMHSIDAIVCLDVLEHVPNPAEMVQLFSGYLKPTGLAIIHAPFWMIMPELATHLECNKHLTANIDQLYTPYNFEPLDSAFVWCPIVLQKTDSPRKIQRSYTMYLRIKFSQFILFWAKTTLLGWLFILYMRHAVMHHTKETMTLFTSYNNRLQGITVDDSFPDKTTKTDHEGTEHSTSSESSFKDKSI